MEDNLTRHSLAIGTRFTAIVFEFLPRMFAAVAHTDATISFSVRVTLRMKPDGKMEVKLIPRSPTIPTPKMAAMPLVLEVADEAQLSLDVKSDYKPSDNAGGRKR